MKAQGSHKQVKKIAKSARQRGLTVAGRDWKEELRERVEKKQRKERMAKDEKKAREDKKVREGSLVEWAGQKKEKMMKASGRDMQLTRMTGEYLACAELCRRGLLATTFTGSVPEFDILATDKDLQTVPIQVKANAKGDWMLNAQKFLDIDYNEKTEIQTIIGKWDFKDSKLIYVFVKVVGKGKDEFYILPVQDLQRIIFKNYDEYLKKHGGRRPRNPKSMHTAILLRHLSGYRDNWELLQEDQKN